jgi:hypothetical protein
MISHMYGHLKGDNLIILLFVHMKFIGGDLYPRNTEFPGWHITFSTRWFKYDRDYLCVNKSQFVSVVFEPPCVFGILDKC